jgi:hypothetical protein
MRLIGLGLGGEKFHANSERRHIPQKVVGRQSLSPTPHNFAADQTETAPRKFKLGPLGSLNQTAR